VNKVKDSNVRLQIAKYLMLHMIKKDTLLSAALNNNLNTLRTLVVKNAKVVNYTDEYLNTMLHAAALGGHASCISWLLKNGCDGVDSVNVFGLSPYQAASLMDHIDCIDLLLDPSIALMDEKPPVQDSIPKKGKSKKKKKNHSGKKSQQNKNKKSSNQQQNGKKSMDNSQSQKSDGETSEEETTAIEDEDSTEALLRLLQHQQSMLQLGNKLQAKPLAAKTLINQNQDQGNKVGSNATNVSELDKAKNRNGANNDIGNNKNKQNNFKKPAKQNYINARQTNDQNQQIKGNGYYNYNNYNNVEIPKKQLPPRLLQLQQQHKANNNYNRKQNTSNSVVKQVYNVKVDNSTHVDNNNKHTLENKVVTTQAAPTKNNNLQQDPQKMAINPIQYHPIPTTIQMPSPQHDQSRFQKFFTQNSSGVESHNSGDHYMRHIYCYILIILLLL
jgi:hypothetical protein